MQKTQQYILMPSNQEMVMENHDAEDKQNTRIRVNYRSYDTSVPLTNE